MKTEKPQISSTGIVRLRGKGQESCRPVSEWAGTKQELTIVPRCNGRVTRFDRNEKRILWSLDTWLWESVIISKDEEQQHRKSDGRVGGRDEVGGEATRSLWVAGGSFFSRRQTEEEVTRENESQGG